MKLNLRHIALAAAYVFIVLALFATMVLAEAQFGEPSRPLTISGCAFLIIAFPASAMLASFPLTLLLLLGQTVAWAFLIETIITRIRRHPTTGATVRR